MREKTYYDHLLKIIRGNANEWYGVFDTQEQTEKALLALVRTLYGSESKEEKAKTIPGRGRIAPATNMTHKALQTLEAYLEKAGISTNIADKEKAQEYIQHIIAQDTNRGLMNAVVRVVNIAERKIPDIEFVPITTSVEIEESVIKKAVGLWADAKQRLKYLDFWSVARRASSILASAAVLTTLQAGGILNRSPGLSQSHACVVGFIPLQHVREIEVARSGKVLKFRATGSVFLAKQQGGGDDAIRISGKFYREELMILLLLWTLYEYGGESPEEFKLTNPLNLDLIDVRVKNIMKINSERAKPSAETYKTFPFVSRHVIIPNVYIETLSFEEKIEDGIGVIRYDILLRTYNKQKAMTTWNTDDPNIKYAVTHYDENLFFHRMFEYGINYLWRYIQAEHIVLNPGSWKVGVTSPGFGNPQARDVYYNIELSDVIGTFTMGAMGFAGMKLGSVIGTTGSVVSEAIGGVSAVV